MWLELSLSYWQREGEIKHLSYREEDHTHFDLEKAEKNLQSIEKAN